MNNKSSFSYFHLNILAILLASPDELPLSKVNSKDTGLKSEVKYIL